MKGKIRMKISTFEKLSDLAQKKGSTPEVVIMEAISAVQQETQSPREKIQHKKCSNREK
jgi:hypothetical protein